ncbi:hypothetical protein M91_21663 [Bos mutus]|uniref:Uncharacterized protein n=1 Tax=Bos mutus TaxID=72004 RepID=L8HU11_9CETA|nr:hypothetical protein M91_21663 [Bos mutus]
MGFLVLLPCRFWACRWLQSFLAKTTTLAHPTSIVGLNELGLSFLPLYKAKKRDTGYFYILKVDSRNVTNSMTFGTKSSNQNFIIFLNKIQATVSGYKRLWFFAILGEVNPDTFPDGRIWLFGFNPYFFRAQFSWHEKCIQKGWPSGLCPNGLSCTVTMPLLGLSVATEFPGKDYDACSSYQHCGPERKTIMFNFNTSSEGIRMLGPPPFYRA